MPPVFWGTAAALSGPGRGRPGGQWGARRATAAGSGRRRRVHRRAPGGGDRGIRAGNRRAAWRLRPRATHYRPVRTAGAFARGSCGGGGGGGQRSRREPRGRGDSAGGGRRRIRGCAPAGGAGRSVLIPELASNHTLQPRATHCCYRMGTPGAQLAEAVAGGGGGGGRMPARRVCARGRVAGGVPAMCQFSMAAIIAGIADFGKLAGRADLRGF